MMMDGASLATKPGISVKACQQLPTHFPVHTCNQSPSKHYITLTKRMQNKTMQFCISTRSVNVQPVLIQVYGSAGTVTSADNCWGLCWACGGQLFGIRFEAERKILAETGAAVRCAKVTDALRCFVFGTQGGPDPEAAESLRCSCIKSLVAKDGTAHPQEIWQLSTLDTGYGSCEL